MVTCLGRYKTNFDYNKLIVQMPLRGLPYFKKWKIRTKKIIKNINPEVACLSKL